MKQTFNSKLNTNNKISSKRKKVVSVAPMNYNQLTQIEKDLYAEKILEFKTKNNLPGEMSKSNNETFLQKSFGNRTNGYFLDQNLEKRVRVMRFLDNIKKKYKQL